jgi:hypothetical protein
MVGEVGEDEELPQVALKHEMTWYAMVEEVVEDEGLP